MSDITTIDKNFIIRHAEKEGLIFYNPKEKPFEVSGLAFFEKDKAYNRCDMEYVHQFSDILQTIFAQTSGGMIRFQTNSSRIAIKAELSGGFTFPHMALSGTNGFDVYTGTGKNKQFAGVAVPQNSDITIIDSEIKLSGTNTEVTVYLPLYSGIKNLEIGLDEKSAVLPPDIFEIKKPLVLYGSSITHGGCVSRGGNTYAAILGRWFDCPVLNFGFPGNAKGEIEVAELISRIDMSVFVLDYDHNAPSLDHLKQTYTPFYETIRKKHPMLPIIMMSRPDFFPCYESHILRRKAIHDAYVSAVESNDKNVYFLDGETLFGKEDRDCCMVDNCHPNDLGAMQIAKGLRKMIKKII